MVEKGNEKDKLKNENPDGKTFAEIMHEVKKNKKTVIKVPAVTISDMPLHLYKKFILKSYQYNDIYWVQLQDLMRKAEAYEYIVGTGLFTDMLGEADDSTDEPDIVNDTPGVLTMTGKKEFRNKGE